MCGRDALSGDHGRRNLSGCRGNFFIRAYAGCFRSAHLPPASAKADTRHCSDLSAFVAPSPSSAVFGSLPLLANRVQVRASGYRVGLYDNPRKNHASERFYMEGSGYPARSRIPIGPYMLTTNDTRPVLLQKGQWAYIYPNTEGNDGPSIFWWQKRSLYHFGRQLPDRVLIRIARSVILVH